MASSTPPLPSPDDDYTPPQGTRWNEATWRAVFTTAPGGIGPRLRALEAQRQTLEDVITELRIFGLQRLDEALLPLINEQEQTLQNLSEQINATIAQTNRLVADFQEATEQALANASQSIADAIDDLESQIAAVQQQINDILANNIGAEHIVETADRVFVTPEQRAEIGALRDVLDDPVAGLGARQLVSEKNQPNGYVGLNASGVMSDAQIAGGIFKPGSLLTSIVNPGDGWLPASGKTYLQSAYPKLFAALGAQKNGRLTFQLNRLQSGTLVETAPCIYVDGDTIITSTNSTSVAVSHNAGQTWSIVPTGLGANVVNIIGRGNEIRVFGSSSGAMYMARSTDRGLSWTRLIAGTVAAFAPGYTAQNGWWAAPDFSTGFLLSGDGIKVASWVNGGLLAAD